MATIEGLLVWSSQALTPWLRKDNTTSPSLVDSRQIIKGKVNILANRKVVMANIEGLLVLRSLRRGVNASEDHTSSPSISIIITLLFSIDHLDHNN